MTFNPLLSAKRGVCIEFKGFGNISDIFYHSKKSFDFESFKNSFDGKFIS